MAFYNSNLLTPLLPMEEEEVSFETDKPVDMDGTALTANSTIMMVDDEPTTMEVVQTFLEDAGYQRFVLIDDSREAFENILEHRPDILLLDLVMPHVTGFDILKRVRTHPQLSYMPVIILTSSSEADTKLQALDEGATDFLAKPVDPSELALRVRNTLAAKAYQDQLAYYDPLTNLPNRRLFVDRLEWAMRQTDRNNNHLAVLHITLNQFKRIYDTFGPMAGEEVIKQVANRIHGCIRNSNVVGHTHSNENDRNELYRLGGNEFSLLCTQLSDTETTAVIASRILRAMKQIFDVKGTEIQMPISIGIAGYPEDAGDIEVLIQRAVIASAQASEKGKARFEFFSKEMNIKSLQRIHMEADLRHAIENDELLLFYQPQVDIKSNKVVGVEALIRWQKPDGRMVFPDQFIPLAEETGLIIPIGEWALKTACRQLALWQNQGIWVSVAVNLSAKQFYEGNLVETVSQTIADSGIDPRYLTLELTESLFMDNAKLAVSTLGGLMALQPKISMDDFGTGYSSLSYLKSFPLNELKIDRSFITDISTNQKDQALVFAIVYLAHEFGLQVVAEGVADESQLEYLASIGCDQYQGYLFSKPVPLANIAPMLTPIAIES
ncbi:MAG: EAL domain-containing protein [Gammaproteobacteria bacterium]|nr:EAL domain-containing protein [Gammaproteobacteria bacterium]